MIVDACMVYNELDMLEARLHILRDVVDVFVIVEGNQTHSGADKPLYAQQQAERFAEFPVRFITADLSKCRHNWDREAYQRWCIRDGLADLAAADYVIVADVDEIPRPEAVTLVADKRMRATRLELDFYYYNVNTRVNQGWSIGMVQWGDGHDPNDIRTLRTFPKAHPLPDAGWHFSYFGGVERIKDKLQHFLHHDWVEPHMLRDDWLQASLAGGKDIWKRDGVQLTHTSTLATLPAHILDNREKYAGWFA